MSLTAKLNPAQRLAVETTEGPVLVLAGPGSGKTRVLTHRIAYLMQAKGVEPYHILAVTFTNKAAEVMRQRTEQLLGVGANLSSLTLGTFHRICARFLRVQAENIGLNPRYVIFDSDDQLTVVKQVLVDLNLDEKRNPPRPLHAAISRAKNELLTPESFPVENYAGEITRRVYERYQKLMRQSNALDFDDLLMETVFMLRNYPDIRARYQRRFEYVLVDEFQDTNTAQYELVRQLTGGHGNIFVVGDEDQSIYRFRGADYRNVDRFRRDFPGCKQILLEQNYRSTQTILDAANAIIGKNRHRTPKNLFSDRGGGVSITVHQAFDEQDEGNFIVDEINRLQARREAKPGECAIMYRTNAQSRAVEEAFVRRNMPYRLVGATRFYSRKEIKDVMAYLRLVQNPDDEVSLRRVINVPPRRIGDATINKLGVWASSLGISLFDAIRLMAGDAPELAKRAGEHPFQKRALATVFDFYLLLRGWLDQRVHLTPAQLLDRILDESGYRNWLRDGTEEGEERWQNVLELRTVATAYENMAHDLALDALLEEIALVSDVDDYQERSDVPTLLTLHAAKGLEFGIVFMVGLEEGLMPHSRSLEDAEQMEEERRLMYVGVTRAENRLYLLHAFKRNAWGRSETGKRSRFLDDVPRKLTASPVKEPSAVKRATSWGGEIQRPVARPSYGNSLRFSPGQTVTHAQFGEGTVITSRLIEGDEEVSVAFRNKGVKRLLASLANLKPA